MRAKRVYLLSLLFIALSCLFVSSCSRKSGCPAVDKINNKKVKKKNNTNLFDKKTRRKMG
ncbi:hypothetical protein [Lewinella sp. 4G2]|uniref:hypothetical protein n=1 Tax=Lewinella sp. 4G2 TaxID=1803372 RepID=UPI0007B46B48|nr:hypothetical protein [Lewinella sp. 4G2]OAV43241.1 hypothetical protein A3850_001445 [Lewinella sp. 4G2]